MAKRNKKNNKSIKVFIISILALIIAVPSILSGLSVVDIDSWFTDAGLTENVPEDKLVVNFIDVGQGDCTLLTCGKTVILVDSGEQGASAKVINYIKNRNIDEIDLCIATHPHTDHIGSFSELFESFKIKDVILPRIPEAIIPTTRTYENFLLSLQKNAENIIPAEVGEKYFYGDVVVEILAPVRDYDNLNDMSVVSKISFGETSVMLTGDAESSSEKDMLKNKQFDYSSDILKLGHHGSDTSSKSAWLKAVSPDYAIISCGTNNRYNHPHREVIERLDKAGIKYLRTDISGDIVFESDGRNFIYINN